MLAYRNVAGNVVEIQVDVDPSGTPLLPRDTTTDPKPAPLADHYVTVVDHSWVQIPVTQSWSEFSYLKQQALQKLSTYKAWYIDQPVNIAGVKYDADEAARARLTQAIVIYNTNGYLPPAWISFDNTPVVLTVIADLIAIVNGVQSAFSTRFFEMDAIRGQINAAANEAALAAITIPQVPVGI